MMLRFSGLCILMSASFSASRFSIWHAIHSPVDTELCYFITIIIWDSGSASATVAGFEFVHAIHVLLNPETLCVFYGTTQIVKFEAFFFFTFLNPYSGATDIQTMLRRKGNRVWTLNSTHSYQLSLCKTISDYWKVNVHINLGCRLSILFSCAGTHLLKSTVKHFQRGIHAKFLQFLD
jgi:hypothetical protein